MTVTIGRRELLIAFGGAVAAWPLAARAQQSERVPRIGVLLSYDLNDPERWPRAKALQEGLGKLGWTDGRNVRVDGGDRRSHRGICTSAQRRPNRFAGHFLDQPSPPVYRVGRAPRAPDCIPVQVLRHGRRSNLVWL